MSPLANILFSAKENIKQNMLLVQANFNYFKTMISSINTYKLIHMMCESCKPQNIRLRTITVTDIHVVDAHDV
jgi:hypothetical protein